MPQVSSQLQFLETPLSAGALSTWTNMLSVPLTLWEYMCVYTHRCVCIHLGLLVQLYVCMHAEGRDLHLVPSSLLHLLFPLVGVSH